MAVFHYSPNMGRVKESKSCSWQDRFRLFVAMRDSHTRLDYVQDTLWSPMARDPEVSR